MSLLKLTSLASITILLPIASQVYAKPPVDIQNLIQKRGAAFKECQRADKAANYAKGFEENNTSCKLAKQLFSQIEEQGWCERSKFSYEDKHEFVGCDGTSLLSVSVDIDKDKDRPETSSLEAEWLLELHHSTSEIKQLDNIGFINFTCNEVDGARTMISVTDKKSGLSGAPFKSELKIDYDVKNSSPYILPTQTDRKTIIFKGKNTLQILRWLHDSVEDFQSMDFIVRENATGNQLYLLMHNSTVQYGEDGPAAKRWAAHMHSMCESFSTRASR